jgi:hypothetical protein
VWHGALTGVVALPHPDAMLNYGAKDAITKLKGTKYGFNDTQGYSTIDEFKEFFPKMLALGERVLKQNDGANGEGYWHVECLTPSKEDCVPLDWKLKCTEAIDNHVEEHCLSDFMTMCEKYFDGKDSMLLDRRFLPRIAEGEVRVTAE